MAKLAVFNKKTTPDTANEWLAKYDDLLRRNRGGGVMQGYDTGSSVRPMVVGGKVVDPTGLGETAAQLSNQPVPTPTPEPQIDLGALTDLLGVDVSNMTPEEIISLIKQQTDNASNATDLINEEINRPVDPNSVPDTSLQPRVETETSKPAYSTSPSGKLSTSPMASAPKAHPVASLGNGMARYSDGSIGPAPDVNSVVKTTQPTQFVQTMQDTADLLGKSDQILQDVNKPAPTLTPDEFNKAVVHSGEETNTRTAADNAGMTVEQFLKNNEDISNDPVLNRTISFADSPKPTNPIADNLSKTIKNVRQTAGNMIDQMAYAIPGTENRKDTGFSEWVAGGPTSHTVMAAEPEYQVSEPDPNMPMQPGAGIDALKGQMQSAQSSGQGIVTKPTMQSIQGMNRSIGDFVGQSGEAVANAKSPNTSYDESPAEKMANPNQALTPVGAPPMSAPANKSFQTSQPSNTQSNQNYSSSSVKSSSPNKSPTPVPTPNKTVTQSSPVVQTQSKVTTPVATPVPTPAPTPTPAKTNSSSSNSSSILTSIWNAISNLFKRK